MEHPVSLHILVSLSLACLTVSTASNPDVRPPLTAAYINTRSDRSLLSQLDSRSNRHVENAAIFENAPNSIGKSGKLNIFAPNLPRNIKIISAKRNQVKPASVGHVDNIRERPANKNSNKGSISWRKNDNFVGGVRDYDIMEKKDDFDDGDSSRGNPSFMQPIMALMSKLDSMVTGLGSWLLREEERIRSRVSEGLFPQLQFLSENKERRLSESNVSPVNQLAEDPVFSELIESGDHDYGKRGAWDLYQMIKCSTGCNPLIFKGYGCYCGFLGSGEAVDGIDRCCQEHDRCYSSTRCMLLEYSLPYFVPYKWSCSGGSPKCLPGKKASTKPNSCSHQLCECDRRFASCLAGHSCPTKKAVCMSPWRHWQNLFKNLGIEKPVLRNRTPTQFAANKRHG